MHAGNHFPTECLSRGIARGNEQLKIMIVYEFSNEGHLSEIFQGPYFIFQVVVLREISQFIRKFNVLLVTVKVRLYLSISNFYLSKKAWNDKISFTFQE